MGNAADYTIPVWHPLVVHFPIATLVLAAVVALVWAVSADARWLLAGCFLAVAGSVGAAVAYLSGDAMKEQAAGVPIVDQLVASHERFALFTLLSAIVAAVAWLAVAFRQRGNAIPPSVVVRLAVTGLSLVAGALVLRAGHLGGLMVWGAPAP
jgi:uncharacterized membrane protein